MIDKKNISKVLRNINYIQIVSPVALGRSIKFSGLFQFGITATFSLLKNNVAETEIKLHRKHPNRPWLGKI